MFRFKDVEIDELEKVLPVNVVKMDNILIIKQDIGEGICKEIEFEINEDVIQDFIDYFKQLKRQL
jgi:hypothetical protein